MDACLSIYGAHDASVCVRDNNGNYRIFELERLVKERYYRFDNKENYQIIYDQLKNIIIKECNISSFKKCYYHNITKEHLDYVKNLWNIEIFEECGHHISHAACSFYQSGFDEAYIISYDGGGFDVQEAEGSKVSFFNIYYGNKENVVKLSTLHLDMGTRYGMTAIPISEIKKTEDNWGEVFLAFAGKLMGLVAYGNVREEWLASFKEFYRKRSNSQSLEELQTLGKNINISLDINELSGQVSYDFAATSQRAFEEVIVEAIQPFLNQKADLPICLAGGCALNVLLNQRLLETSNRQLFVPPNPSDCGLAFGMMVLKEPPSNVPNITYSGFPILDLDKLEYYVEKYNAKQIATKEIATLLSEGKILALMHGNSEHGPRALGNRSILCDPSFPEMKDILNHKVKFREWFRPFAPVVPKDRVNEFFHFEHDATFMSYSPKVRDEWKEKLSSIVHHDGTARVQTLTFEQNDYLFSILQEMNNIKNIPIVLNTSFNIKGKPILTTIEDAIEVLETTQIDGLIIEGFFFERNKVNE